MDLGFEQLALEAFGFLESKYGYQCVESGPWRVTYRSSKVLVSAIFDGNRSYELGCEIGRTDNYAGSGEVPFNLGELLRCEGEVDAQSSAQVTTAESLAKYAKHLASLLEKYGHPFLLGDDAAFGRLASLRNRECADYATGKRLQQARAKLEDAWRSKKYVQIVELLSPLQEWLEPSEVKKLQYARKQLSS